jgi:hypothetical protein
LPRQRFEGCTATAEAVVRVITFLAIPAKTGIFFLFLSSLRKRVFTRNINAVTDEGCYANPQKFHGSYARWSCFQAARNASHLNGRIYSVLVRGSGPRVRVRVYSRSTGVTGSKSSQNALLGHLLCRHPGNHYIYRPRVHLAGRPLHAKGPRSRTRSRWERPSQLLVSPMQLSRSLADF